MKQTRAALLSDSDSGGGVIFWIWMKPVVLTDKMNEGLYTQAASQGF